MANIELSGKAKMLHREEKIEQPKQTEIDVFTTLVARFTSVLTAFILAPIVSIFVCLSYNKIVSSFGFFEPLIASNQIPVRLSYFTALGFLWVLVGIRSLFVKGA